MSHFTCKLFPAKTCARSDFATARWSVMCVRAFELLAESLLARKWLSLFGNYLRPPSDCAESTAHVSAGMWRFFPMSGRGGGVSQWRRGSRRQQGCGRFRRAAVYSVAVRRQLSYAGAGKGGQGRAAAVHQQPDTHSAPRAVLPTISAAKYPYSTMIMPIYKSI